MRAGHMAALLRVSCQSTVGLSWTLSHMKAAAMQLGRQHQRYQQNRISPGSQGCERQKLSWNQSYFSPEKGSLLLGRQSRPTCEHRHCAGCCTAGVWQGGQHITCVGTRKGCCGVEHPAGVCRITQENKHAAFVDALSKRLAYRSVCRRVLAPGRPSAEHRLVPACCNEHACMCQARAYPATQSTNTSRAPTKQGLL